MGSVRAFSEGDTCYIGKLIVDPSYHNRGLGKQLLQEIEDRFFQGVQRFELFTGDKSEKNLSFYQMNGYELFRKEQVTYTLKLLLLEKLKDTD